MKKVMNKKDFIDKHILPMESKDTIIGYLQGEVDFDEDYLKEVADEHELIINEASNEYRKKFRCYIVDEDNWDETYEELTEGSLTECLKEAKNELERMIEEFDEDKEDFKEDLEKVEAFLKNPKEELSKVKEGYKPLYVNAPLGYTISIE